MNDNDFLFSYVVALIIGFCSFLLVVDFSTLDPTNIRWLMIGSTDSTTHFLGWTFFSADEWHLPPGLNPNYGLELSSSVIFSDSIPLMALLSKIIAPLMPEVFQYTGWWLLFCFILQAYFTVRIVGLISQSMALKILVAILIVFSPPFLYRLGAHFALFGHWIILAGILIYFANDADNRVKQIKWALLIAISVLVHTYFIPMVMALWTADLYKRCRTHKTPLLEKWPEVVSIFFSTLFILWIAGFFPLVQSYLSGGYGIHRFNLLSLFNPHGVNSLNNEHWSYLLPALPQGYGDYEGFNYLGLGSLVFVLIAGVIAFRDRQDLPFKKLLPILIAALLLFLFSISNKIGLGTWNLEIWIPRFLKLMANILRSSGRFFWPVYYLLILASVWLCVSKFGSKKTSALLCFLVVAQIADTRTGWAEFSSKFQSSGKNISSKYDHPDLEILTGQYKKLRVLPKINAGVDWDKRAYFALKHGMKTDSVYLARYNDKINIEIMNAVEDRIEKNLLDKEALYFVDKKFAALIFAKLSDKDSLFLFDKNVYIYAPNWLTFQISRPIELKPAQF